MIYNHDFFLLEYSDDFISLPYNLSMLCIREHVTCSQASHGQYEVAYFYYVLPAVVHEK
jgi:hypothetical protein